MRVPRPSLSPTFAALVAGATFACAAPAPLATPAGDPAPKTPAARTRTLPARPERPRLTLSEARARLPGLSFDGLDDAERGVLVAVAERAPCPVNADTTLADRLAAAPDDALPRRMLGFATELARLGAHPDESVKAVTEYFGAFAAEARATLTPSPGACRGPADAPVSLIEFGDFECFFCGSAWGLVHQVREAFPDQVRVCFLHFPLAQHPGALDAARLAELASAEGRFFELAELLFLHQDALDHGGLLSLANKAGLDPSKAEKALASKAYAEAVAAQRAQGERADVHGTPTLFLNGRRFDLPLQRSLLVHAIEDELVWLELGGRWSGD